jgi:hypothetical protein
VNFVDTGFDAALAAWAPTLPAIAATRKKTGATIRPRIHHLGERALAGLVPPGDEAPSDVAVMLCLPRVLWTLL